MKFHEKMKRRREALGLTQAGLGLKVGRLQGRIHKWENGEGNPSPATLLALAEALGVPLRYLCDDRIDSPDAALAGETSLTESERRIWSIVHQLGADRALARLLAMPEPIATRPAEAAALAPAPAPGTAKTLARVRVVKKAAPRAATPPRVRNGKKS